MTLVFGLPPHAINAATSHGISALWTKLH